MSETPTLTINGRQYAVGEVSPTSRLASFLHDNHLLGTHTTCFEGGCGACIVVATVTDPDTGKKDTHTVNSCLVPVLACVGWEITTIEGLGNKHEGYHLIEERLAEYSGTQCGYCTPGMVMSMYGLTQGGAAWSPRDVEHQLDGSLCRCTGYRPILEAFKSILPQDIEDAEKARCPASGRACTTRSAASAHKGKAAVWQRLPRTVPLSGTTWHQPSSLQELLDTLAGLPEGAKYTLVCGNTAQAMYSDGPYTDYIYTGNVSQLSSVSTSPEALVFGANCSISRLLAELSATATTVPGFGYLPQLVETWKYTASTSIRNMSSWAGNLATKVAHPEFSSDLFVGLLAAGATVTTAGPDGATSHHTLEELLKVDLVGGRRVILSMSLPPLTDDVIIRTMKVMPRATNSMGDVTAGFRLRVDVTAAHTVLDTPVIAFGGINPSFVRASATEAALAGKSLEDAAVLQAALAALASEVIPDSRPPLASPEYRLALTQTFLYRVVLRILGNKVPPAMTSGANGLVRPLSSGQQTFDPNSETWPLGQPIPKLEAAIQCSGEAEYVSTMPAQPGELFGVFVTSTQANARIASIDTSAALDIPGVVDFVGVEDIAGVNNIQVLGNPSAQPLFAAERVEYYGQPLGLLVAADRGSAYAGRAAVKVTYDDIQPPVLTIEEALNNPLPPGQNPPTIHGDVEAGFAASTHIVEGAMKRGGQFHYHMETQVTVVNPTDTGLDVHSSTQWASETQRAIGQVLGILDNKVYVTCKRLGGGFGAKFDQCNIVAAAAALAAHKTQQPVRVQLDLSANFAIVGGREPYLCTYKVGCDDAGILQALQVTLTSDSGYSPVDVSSYGAADSLQSCYTCANMEITPQFVLTNTPSTTWCRCPGTMEGVTFMENIMDHVAAELGMDPLELRQKNLLPDGTTRRINKKLFQLRSLMAGQEPQELPDTIKIEKNLIADMITQLLDSAQVQQRQLEVAQLNTNNIWKKRGLSVMPMLWPYGVPLVTPFSVLVSVNARDGSVSISHGGAEMGQGLNTKVAQVAAYELGVPLDLIDFTPTNVHSNANSSNTAGSLGSDVCSYCVGEACKLIKARLDTHRREAGLSSASWQEVVSKAFNAGVDISQRYVNGPKEVVGYAVFGVACTEVELDVLTGQFVVLRTDLLEDAGRSLSPLVDVGQVEGAFVMGQGLFTTEQPILDSTTGKMLTDSTKTYFPPYALDIPADFRVTLLHDAPNPLGVQSSKVTGEPPLCLSFTVPMALRQAVTSARSDAGTTGWFQMDAPFTTERLQRLCLVDAARLVIN